ncbi:MAG: hypothetical protein J0M01_03430 [Dechloromonas sp.]|jgi:hypothetical protein|nr:hypothetical protein [Dechloromonas sp.]
MRDQSNQVGSGQAGMDSKSAGRRRFVRGVGIATPVILTVASRSALASTCLSPSAQASIALDRSRPDRRRGSECFGKRPDFWKEASNEKSAHHGHWKGCGAEDRYFSACFSASDGFNGKTLKDVLASKGQDDPFKLGSHLCAAWCNLQTGKVPASVLSLETMKSMWAGRNGNYQPVAGVFWGAPQIVEYIKRATMV